MQQQGRGSGRLIVGQKGVKYGLQTRGPPGTGGPGGAGRGSGAGPAKPPPHALPAFAGGSDSDDEDDVGAQVARQAVKKRSDAKVQGMYEAALAEDPTAFDYDGVYDSMRAAKAEPRHQERVDRRPKYIATLLEHAQLRKREQDVLHERQLHKERVAAEAEEGAPQEVFVTAAYRRKLEEDKLWQEEQRRKELEEEKADVRKVGHMGNFYKNLLTANVAFGKGPGHDEQPSDNALSKSTDDTSQQVLPDAAGRQVETEPLEAAGSPTHDTEDEEAAPIVDPKRLEGLSHYEVLKLKAAAIRARQTQGGKQHAGNVQGVDLDSSKAPGGQDERISSGSLAGVSQPDVGGRSAAPSPTATADTAVAAPAAMRRNDDGAVMSARERYLARKRQREGGG